MQYNEVWKWQNSNECKLMYEPMPFLFAAVNNVENKPATYLRNNSGYDQHIY